MAGAMSSSLHHNVRFVINGKMITVHGETNFATYKKSVIPYIELEIKEESSYHSFEMISIIEIPTGSVMKSPELSTSSIMSGKVLCHYGFNLDDGLGTKAQGIKEPIIIPVGTKKKYGVGYEVTSNHHGGRSQSQKNHEGR